MRLITLAALAAFALTGCAQKTTAVDCTGYIGPFISTPDDGSAPSYAKIKIDRIEVAANGKTRYHVINNADVSFPGSAWQYEREFKSIECPK